MVTSSGQSVFHKQWYSAFGESGTSATMRYGFAGAHGYQQDPTGDAFPFMHVGARYYDPATGRFLQRDPIGIAGGLNVYSYVGSRPTVAVDPEGLWGDIIDAIDLTEDPYNRSGGRSDEFKDGVDKARRKIRGAFLLGCANPWATWPFAVRLGFWVLGWREILL